MSFKQTAGAVTNIWRRHQLRRVVISLLQAGLLELPTVGLPYVGGAAVVTTQGVGKISFSVSHPEQKHARTGPPAVPRQAALTSMKWPAVCCSLGLEFQPSEEFISNKGRWAACPQLLKNTRTT
jgi:hypothetical protein